MAEAPQQPQKIRAFNKNGNTKEFTPVQWRFMKVFPDGSRQGWRELAAGASVQDAIKSANIPDELKKFSAGGKVDISNPEIQQQIKAEVDKQTKGPTVFRQSLEASIRKELEKELEEAATAHAEQKRLADYILQNHPDKIGEGSAVDVAIAIMSASATDVPSAKSETEDPKPKRGNNPSGKAKNAAPSNQGGDAENAGAGE